jgi:Kef-type K+ transport system membrane component KefB
VRAKNSRLLKSSDILFYFGTIILAGTLIYWIVQQGSLLEYKKLLFLHPLPGVQASHAVNTSGTLVILIQTVTILIATRIVGYAMARIGQPSVIGEIIAGIILGPSLLGQLFPAAEAFLFPKESMFNLQMLGQLGLILFMFVIGTELDLSLIRRQARAAIIISHSSIIVPFTIGLAIAYFLYPRFAPQDISFLSFALFMGISVSITAFPVLARILQERRLTGTPIGTMAITCAATDDVTAWCLLAIVVAIVKTRSTGNAVYTIALAAGFVLLMLLAVRPLLKRLLRDNGGAMSRNSMAVLFVLLLFSACVAEYIGIHALFGAFLAGVVVPHNIDLKKSIVDKIEYVSVILLLPLFFAFSGLRTSIGLLNDGQLWLICLFITLMAVLGKFGGTALAARFVGQSTRDSLALGALMNTRGLVELVVLNIGYDLGVFPPVIFTMMVLMALITTFMTAPSLDLINRMTKPKKAI